MRRFVTVCAFVVATGAVAPADAIAGPGEQAIVEFHYKPVPDLQIAIWLEDTEGNFVRDVYVSQATATLGIANRPGLWNFLSSWHFPYGPRVNVLPIWAHRRGKTYPKIVFHDSSEKYKDSLGFHEGTSSDEPYFCRPMTADEDKVFADVMSCPTPKAFNSDKGRFADDGATSVYPPRTDITVFDEEHDHADIEQYPGVNDLDAVAGATPVGNMPIYESIALAWDEIGDTELVAWIEVSREHDENANWDFDRVADHYVDPYLDKYGIEWLGQPAMVYRVQFSPGQAGVYATDAYHGYADLEGTTGTVHPPDATISTSNGSGSDRLQSFDLDGQSVRFAVETTGWEAPGEGSGCMPTVLPAVEDLKVRPIAFDRVELALTLPSSVPTGTEISRITAYLKPHQDPLPEASMKLAEQRQFMVCPVADEGCQITAGPGDTVLLELDRLFGDYTYQLGVAYEDRCTNVSTLAMTNATTPVQEFQQIDTMCFVATAAFGAGWLPEVAALRGLRDAYLRAHPLGRQAVRAYYAYGPVLAGLIADNAWARAVTRMLLQPIADLARLTLRAAPRRPP